MPEGNLPPFTVPTTPQPLAGPDDLWNQYFGDPTEQQFMFNDIRARHAAALMNDGDDFFWVKRRLAGTRCPFWSDDSQQCREPLNADATCYNTGYLGGYEVPLAIKIALPNAMKQAMSTEGGIIQMQDMRPWTIWTPVLANRDFVVNFTNGRRFELLKVEPQGQWRGLFVCQFFDVRPMQDGVDYAYKFPVAPTGR